MKKLYFTFLFATLCALMPAMAQDPAGVEYAGEFVIEGVTTLEKSIFIESNGDNTCTITVPDIQIPYGSGNIPLGDVVMPNITVVSDGDVKNYSGHVENMKLMMGLIKANVDLEGSEQADGSIVLNVLINADASTIGMGTIELPGTFTGKKVGGDPEPQPAELKAPTCAPESGSTLATLRKFKITFDAENIDEVKAAMGGENVHLMGYCPAAKKQTEGIMMFKGNPADGHMLTYVEGSKARADLDYNYTSPKDATTFTITLMHDVPMEAGAEYTLVINKDIFSVYDFDAKTGIGCAEDIVFTFNGDGVIIPKPACEPADGSYLTTFQDFTLSFDPETIKAIKDQYPDCDPDELALIGYAIDTKKATEGILLYKGTPEDGEVVDYMCSASETLALDINFGKADPDATSWKLSFDSPIELEDGQLYTLFIHKNVFRMMDFWEDYYIPCEDHFTFSFYGGEPKPVVLNAPTCAPESGSTLATLRKFKITFDAENIDEIKAAMGGENVHLMGYCPAEKKQTEGIMMFKGNPEDGHMLTYVEGSKARADLDYNYTSPKDATTFTITLMHDVPMEAGAEYTLVINKDIFSVYDFDAKTGIGCAEDIVFTFNGDGVIIPKPACEPADGSYLTTFQDFTLSFDPETIKAIKDQYPDCDPDELALIGYAIDTKKATEGILLYKGTPEDGEVVDYMCSASETLDLDINFGKADPDATSWKLSFDSPIELEDGQLYTLFIHKNVFRMMDFWEDYYIPCEDHFTFSFYGGEPKPVVLNAPTCAPESGSTLATLRKFKITFDAENIEEVKAAMGGENVHLMGHCPAEKKQTEGIMMFKGNPEDGHMLTYVEGSKARADLDYNYTSPKDATTFTITLMHDVPMEVGSEYTLVINKDIFSVYDFDAKTGIGCAEDIVFTFTGDGVIIPKPACEPADGSYLTTFQDFNLSFDPETIKAIKDQYPDCDPDELALIGYAVDTKKATEGILLYKGTPEDGEVVDYMCSASETLDLDINFGKADPDATSWKLSFDSPIEFEKGQLYTLFIHKNVFRMMDFWEDYYIPCEDHFTFSFYGDDTTGCKDIEAGNVKVSRVGNTIVVTGLADGETATAVTVVGAVAAQGVSVNGVAKLNVPAGSAYIVTFVHDGKLGAVKKAF